MKLLIIPVLFLISAPVFYVHTAGAEKKTSKMQKKSSKQPRPQRKTQSSSKKNTSLAQKSKKGKTSQPAAVQKPTKKPNVRNITQLPNTDLNQSIDSVEHTLDALPAVCQSNSSLEQKTKDFQKKLVTAKQKLRQIKEDFIIRDPSLYAYINTLDFYLNRPQEFNYEKKVPKNIEKLKEYISGLTLSFQMMYRTAFNVPEDTPANKFPEGWGRSIIVALTCLQNHQ